MNENLQLKKQTVQKIYIQIPIRYPPFGNRENARKSERQRKRERELQGRAVEEQTFAPAGKRPAMADSIIVVVVLFLSLSIEV